MRIERRIAHLCCELVECVLEAINVSIHMAIARWRHIAILVLLHSAVGMAIGLDSRFVLQRMNLLAIYIYVYYHISTRTLPSRFTYARL